MNSPSRVQFPSFAHDARDQVIMISFSAFVLSFSIFLNKCFATKGFFLVNVSQLINSYFFKTKKEIRFSLLFTTATKNQSLTIFFPFSSSSSKCRITPGGYGFFSTNWSPPFTTSMGMVDRVHNYSSYYRTFT